MTSGSYVTFVSSYEFNSESLQDTSTYTSAQTSGSFSITVGPTCGGISASKSNIDSNYQSVTQQSGIKAGDGGFQVDVKGKTDLKGAVIASTQAAVAQARNTFTTGALSFSDIRNSASYQGKAVGLSVDVGQQAGKYGVSGVGVGIGSDKGDASSTSTSGISGIAGNTAVRSTDAETGIKPTFDADKVQREINAQMQITQAFSKEAPKAVATYADEKLKAAQAKGDQAEIDKWKEGGSARVALHMLVGGLAGGLGGAVGAATSQTLVPLLGDEIAKLDIPVELKQALVAAAGAAIGATTGGAAGAASGLVATANNYLTATDLRSKEKKLQDCRSQGSAQCEVNVFKEYDLKSANNSGEISHKTVLSEVFLKGQKDQLEQLLLDPSVSDATKAQARQSIAELSVAINVIQKSPVLRDAAELGLILADVAMLGTFATAKVLTSTLVREFVLAKTGKAITPDAATTIANNFYRDGVNPPSWTPGRIQDIGLNSSEHWTKHGTEFPGITSGNEYVAAANKFIANPPQGTQSFTRSNGDKLFYDASSNTFAVQAPSGMPRTMFKPAQGDIYWLKQTGFIK